MRDADHQGDPDRRRQNVRNHHLAPCPPIQTHPELPCRTEQPYISPLFCFPINDSNRFEYVVECVRHSIGGAVERTRWGRSHRGSRPLARGGGKWKGGIYSPCMHLKALVIIEFISIKLQIPTEQSKSGIPA